MVNFSRLRDMSLPYNCYEVGHTWTPICSEAALTIGYTCLIEGIKIYAPLYLASQALQKKFSLKAFLSTIHSTCVSSCFLSFNGFSFIVIFCFLRKLMGKFYYLHCSYFPAFVASFLAILIERKNRRGPLALYVTNVASETIFRMAVARGKVKPFPNGEVYLFSATMAFFLYMTRKQGFSNDIVSVALRYLVGKHEAKQRSKSKALPEAEGSLASPISETAMDVLVPQISKIESNDNTLFRRLIQFFRSFWSRHKHQSCPHPESCSKYTLQGFVQPFMAGYLTYASIQILFKWQKVVANPSLLVELLANKQVFNLGIFLGGFSGTYRLVNCLCRWVFGYDQEVYAFPAAFLGGLFMRYFPSSTLALYLTWKLIELSYLLGIDHNVLPRIQGSMVVLYACSTAILFYAAVLEPHNLKPAYLKFLNRITHDRLSLINRHVLDIFGTHASKLYSNFWPELDLRHCSRVFQESVLLWLIN